MTILLLACTAVVLLVVWLVGRGLLREFNSRIAHIELSTMADKTKASNDANVLAEVGRQLAELAGTVARMDNRIRAEKKRPADSPAKRERRRVPNIDEWGNP